MFNAEEIRKLLTQAPFQPFRFRMSDGTGHDVLHPEMVIVTRNYVIVPSGVNDTTGVAATVTRLAIIHIGKVEDIQQAA